MQSIKKIFQKQKQILTKQHQQALSSLSMISQVLQTQYQKALKKIDTAKFYVNQIFIKQLKQVIESLKNILQINSTNRLEISEQRYVQNKELERNPYLIDLSLMESPELFKQQKQIFQKENASDFFIKNKKSSHVVVSKILLDSGILSKLTFNCPNVISIELKSHSYKDNYIINNDSLQKLSSLSNLIALDISKSAVTDQGLIKGLKNLTQLKQLNISECCLLTDQTINMLSSENNFVNLKLNNLNSISEQAVLDLINYSYNLNYLEVKNSRHLNHEHFFIEVSKIYDTNRSSFKWLEITFSSGIDLYINKLAYLTHLTSVESITDKQFEILLGNDKTYITGLFFTCCEQLNIASVQLICKQIQNLKRLKLTRFIKLNDTHIRQLLSQFINLEYLNLGECYSLTNRSLQFISDFSKNLRYLCLEWCKAINDQGLEFLAEKYCDLEHLNLSNLKFISDYGLMQVIQNCSNLKALYLEKCDQITDDSIILASQKLPNLQELVVNYCQSLTDSSLSIVSTRLLNLSRLQIQWCGVSQKCISYIADNLKKLKILNLNYCPSVCDKQILLFCNNSKSVLEVLKLQSCDKISEEAFLVLSQISKKIKYLGLRQCIGVTDEIIKYFCISSQARIRHIDLGWCTQITDKSLFFLSQYQHQLNSINLSGCVEVTDIGIQWISTTLKNLQSINLSLCQNITDKSIVSISKLIKLKKLFLCDLKNITDISISNLSELSDLQELHLSGCTDISSSSLLAILHNLEKLSSLNINECNNIKSEFLTLTLDKLKNLRKLEISSLEIDDQFLKGIGFNLEKLQYLNVSFCHKITQIGLIRLVESVPSLIRLDFQSTSTSNRAKQQIVQTLNCRKMYNITLD